MAYAPATRPGWRGGVAGGAGGDQFIYAVTVFTPFTINETWGSNHF